MGFVFFEEILYCLYVYGFFGVNRCNLWVVLVFRKNKIIKIIFWGFLKEVVVLLLYLGNR